MRMKSGSNEDLIGSVGTRTRNFFFQNPENSDQKAFPNLSQTSYYDILFNKVFHKDSN